MANTTLIKSTLRNSIADGIFNEISNRNSRYFYFLGKTLTWANELLPLVPVDSLAYENATRDDIITVKEISPTDVAYVIPRYDWVFGQIYDQYDDQYSTEVIGINLIAGGAEYTTVPSVYIGSTGYVDFAPITGYNIGALLKSGVNYYIVSAIDISVVTGTTGITAPTHTTGTVENGTVFLTHVTLTDANGSGATAVAHLTDGVITSIDITNKGIGYTSIPSVTIIGEGGTISAVGAAVITKGPKSLKQKIEDCQFYVFTDEHNVYICLDNNNGAISTVKPVDTDFDPVKLSDGYTWKFMYNVPIGLRNKFLTTAYIPVVASIQDQFYSNGNIQVVRVDQAGTGYTSANISVIGDGFLESNPIYLTGIILENGGSGYVTPTITIDPPFSHTIPWVANLIVVTGQSYSYLDEIYKVAVSGQFGTVAPVHRFGTVSNGTATLTWVGTTATANITESGGIINSITLNQNIRDVSIINNGSGYLTPPLVTFVGGSGTNSNAIAVVSNGTIARVTIIDSGKNYLTIPTVVIGTPWVAATVVILGTQIFHGNNLYTVTGGTLPYTTDSTPPIHTSGAVTNGTAQLTYAGVAATASCTLKCGAGYGTLGFTPLVHISGAPGAGASAYFSTIKSDAKLIPIIEGGQLSRVQIDDGGIGYTYATLTISGDGDGAAASAQLSIGDANTLQSNVELLTVDGTINNIPVISGGFGYTSATVTITGDGTGALAEAVVVGGAITKINMINPGKNYRWATVSITGIGVNVTSGGFKYTEIPAVTFSDGVGDGSGTTATAAISGGAVISVLVTNNGSAYTVAPTVTIGAPFITFDGTTSVNAGADTITYNGQLFNTGDSVTYSLGGGTAISGEVITFASVADVSTTTHQLSAPSHPFIVGDQVRYDNGTGIDIGGLVDGTLYYVIPITANSIKLASSYANAGNGVAIAISAGGVVQTIPVVTGGAGYTSGTVTVTVTPAMGDTTGAGASGVAVISGGIITSITVTGGSGYTAVPSVTLVEPANITSTGTGLGPLTPTGTGNSGENTIVVSSYTDIASGMYVSGTGIAPGTKVSVTPGTTTVILDTPNSGAVSGTITFTSPLITVASYTGIVAGMLVTGTGIASGAKVAVTPLTTTITLDLPNTGTVSGTITFLRGGSLGTPTITSSVSQTLTYKLNHNQNYYVISTPNTIQLSRILSGTAINFSAAGTGIAQRLTLNSGAAEAVAVMTPDAIGYGAKLRAVIAPYGGYGKEALNNLFARTLMFYSNISADKNQGFTVNNDYRQIGIIKNARQFQSTYSLTGNLSSACWVLSTNVTIDPALYPLDSIIYLNYAQSNQTRYRIVSNAGLSVLVQSLDNGTPLLNATFVNSFSNGRGASFVAATVTPPTMDKYSGDLLFIDNKQAFTPSAEQIVSIRTVLKF